MDARAILRRKFASGKGGGPTLFPFARDKDIFGRGIAAGVLTDFPLERPGPCRSGIVIVALR